jgi:putative inorganic carbon (HCO3(-)) transporter
MPTEKCRKDFSPHLNPPPAVAGGGEEGGRSFLDSALKIALTVLALSLTFSKALAEVTFTVALVLWVYKKIRRKEKFFPREILTVLILVFFGLSAFSLLVSDYKLLSLRGIGKLGEELLVFFMVADSFRTRRELRRLGLILSIGFLVVGLNGVWQFVTGKDLIREIPVRFAGTNVRLSSSMGEPGIFGAYLAASIPLFLSLAVTRNALNLRRRIGALFLVLLGGFCIFNTQSRAAWLSLLFALGCLSLLKRQKWLIGALVALAIIALFFLPRSMVIHLDAESKEQSLVERYFLWDRAVQVIKARPWLGCGINTYVKSYPKFDRTKSWRVQYYYAHNGYLQIAAERGLPTLTVFIVFLIVYYRKLLRWDKKCSDAGLKSFLTGLLAGISGILAFAFVDTVLETMVIGLLLWFLMGLAISILRLDSPGETDSQTGRGVPAREKNRLGVRV